MKKVVDTEDMQLRLDIFNEIYIELTLHSESEQKTFYRALNKTQKIREEVEHGKEEHSEIKSLLKTLKKPISNDLWLINFGELKSMVYHHIDEEENDMFPLAKKALSKAKAESITEEMENEKQKMLSKDKF